jgi:phage terminase large subunit-like protein
VVVVALLEDLNQYSNDIIAGTIIACKKHKWTCMRFLQDLERQGAEDFPYIFDEDKAQHYLDWMGLFKHTKGPLEGTYKVPEPIEKFIFGNIYGWVHEKTEYRRFRKAYWQVARKNAKSQDLAIVGLYEISEIGEPCSEVYVAATKKDQTKYVWNEANLIYKRSILKDKLKTVYGEIRHPKSGSVFSRMSEEDKKKGDGSNPQCGIIDEYHAHETSEYYDILTSGMKTRKQPLLIIITTAGFDLNHPCYRDEYDYVSKIINPDNPINNDRYFVMINELDKDEEGNLIDDIKDERVWIKANPIVAKTDVGLESLRDELKVALDKPEKMRDFLTKSMNVWVNQRESGYMLMDKWAACGATKSNPFPDLSGLKAIGGVDLSSTIDLASTGFEILLPDGRIAILSHSFIPEEKLAQKRNTDKVPYDIWVDKGWITATPGASIDYHFILDYIIKVYEKYNWPKGEVCFDRYLATWLEYELEDRGFTPVDIAQGIPTLSEPTKDFRAKTYSSKIIHDNNPVLGWAISNAIVRANAQDNIMLDKGKSTERIDPIAAIINAHVRVITKGEDTKSVYEERGVRSV